MNAVVRVDSSYVIGTGHVMRCLTLAEQLREHGYQVIFVSRDFDGSLINFIESKGYHVKKLKKPSEISGNVYLGDLPHSQWLGTTQEIDFEETLQQIADIYLDLLIVDNYALDYRWEVKFNKIAEKIFVIDDLADRKHYCDFLLDQNLYSSMYNRYDTLICKSNCKLILGPKNSLLRKEFIEVKSNLRNRSGKINNILVFFGGSDLTNETLKALYAIEDLKRSDISIDVVIGQSNINKQRIEKFASTMQNVKCYYQVTNMAELIETADIAIGAGGSTTWERAFLGLPSITIEVAQNQSELLKDLNDCEILINLGKSEKVSKETIKSKLQFLLDNPLYVKKISDICLNLFNSSFQLSKFLEGPIGNREI